ncbi:MAG: protein kinase domain-containing protein [Gemmatimonas sp.]
MSAGHWVELEQLMDDVLDAPAENRRELLLVRCAHNPGMYETALAWLDACEADAGLLNERPIDFDFSAGLSAGARVGNWRLLGEIGRGGMGAVYLAERVDAELPMKAALKFMHRAISFDAIGVRRFRDERRILAALEHPAIARLLDGGVDDGLPWFAMEYVQGATIDQWCDRRRLSIEERVMLFCKVCEAVQHAHARLIVHRDLKPANVLVSEDGNPKLLDFGIAKLLADAGSNTVTSAMTHPGSQPMTAAYAAPEQVRGDAPSTATDVYSLGVMLHMLLAGRLPRPNMRMSQTPTLVADHTRTDPALVDSIAEARGTTLVRLQRQLQGDLDTIVARATHADPQRRYATASALAEDLQRHVDGRPVLARPDTAAYRFRKLIARHPFGATLAIAGAALVATFVAVTVMQSSRLRIQAAELRDQALKLTAERDKANEVTQFLTDVISSANPYQQSGHVPTLHEVLDRGATLAETSLRDRPEVRAHLMSSMAPAYFGLGDWNRAGDLAEEAVNIRRRILDANDPEIAAALIYLTSVRMNQGRMVEAERHIRESIAIYNTLPNVDHDDLVSAVSTLGVVLQRQGKLEDAGEVLRSLLTQERARTPLDSARVAQLSRNLGHVMRDRRAYAEAVPLYQAAYDMHVGLFGTEHPESANSAVNLGNAYAKVGDAVTAESLLRAGVRVKRKTLGLQHPDVIADQLTLASALDAFGKKGEARELRVEAEAERARLSRKEPATAKR